MNRDEMLKEAQTFLDNGDLDKAKELLTEVRSLDTSNEKAKVEEETKDKDEDVNNVKEEKQKTKEESKKSKEEDDDEETEKRSLGDVNITVDTKELTEAINELTKNKESEQRSLKGDTEEMEKVILDGKEVVGEQTEVRSFLDYVRSRDVSTRAFDTTGVKSADASAIIPEEIITKARKLPETVVDLRSKVTVQNVTHASGTYPILKPNKAVLVSVEELKANPDLDKPQFDDIDYKVSTYRGQLAVAQEALDDSDDNLGGIIASHIQRQALNTANQKLGALLRTAEAATAKSVDELKTLVNTGFDPAYGLEWLVSQSFYNEVDLLKDGNGRYLLQDSISATSGKSLLGLNVTVLADDLIGTAKGDKVAFLGDPKSFAVYFNRLSYTARWVEEIYYGQVLAVGMRFDAKVVDPAAGKFITLDTTTP